KQRHLETNEDVTARTNRWSPLVVAGRDGAIEHRAEAGMGKRVFVTVGTTSFDELISCVSSECCTSILRELGYSRMILQIGRGTVEPEPYNTPNFSMDVFRYKDSLVRDIRNADLVISHAGAGSCLETLEEKKTSNCCD
ncbi:unnamed protein product, partial [Staurois parvus]